MHTHREQVASFLSSTLADNAVWEHTTRALLQLAKTSAPTRAALLASGVKPALVARAAAVGRVADDDISAVADESELSAELVSVLDQ